MTDFEKIMIEIGDFGAYQVYSIILLQFCFLAISPSYQMGSVFYAIEPSQFTCSENLINSTVVPDNKKTCDILGTNDTCTSGDISYRFDDNSMESSVVTDFELYCERAQWVKHSTTLFMLGTGLGAVALQSAADFIGRLRCALLFVVIISSINFAMSYSTDFIMWLVLRFLTGIFTSATYGVCYTYVLELLTEQRRMLLGVINSITFGIGTMYFSVLAYFFRDWRVLARAVALSPILPVIIAFFTLVESPRWLMSRNRMAEARKGLNRIAKMNKSTVPVDEMVDEMLLDEANDQALNKEHEPKKQDSIKDFLDKRIAIMTSANCYLWVTLCVIYYGVSLSATSMAGNPFHNNALSGSAESVAALIAVVFVNKVSRRSYVFWAMITSGLSLILLSGLSAQFPIEDFAWMKYVVLVLNNFAKLTCCLVWTVAFVYCGEIYPTRWRSTGSGLASGAARFGSMIAPQLAFGGAYSWLPGCIMGLIGITGGIAARLLPNSMGHPQPESFGAVRKMYGSRGYWSIM